MIDSDQIYKITKIDDGRLYYSPASTNGHHPTVTGSIPAQNALNAGFRPPLQAEDIKAFFKELSQARAPTEEMLDPKFFKDSSVTNDPFQIIRILKQLWKTKNIPNTNFSINNRDTLEKLLTHLSAEFGLVLKKSPDTIKKQLLTTLAK